MYSQKQDPLNQPCHRGYRQHQQQRWPDQSQNIHEFSGLHPPPPTTQASVNNKRSSQGPISSIDHHRSLENQHLPYRNAPSTYHTSHLSHIRGPHMQHQQPRPSVLNCPPQHHVVRQQHHIQRPPSLGFHIGPSSNYTEPVETNAVHTLNYTEHVISPQNKEKMESGGSLSENVRTPTRQVSSNFQSKNPRALQPVDSNIRSDHLLLSDKCNSKQNVPCEATPVAAIPVMKRFQASILSPISKCFSHMLGAAEMIKTPAGKNSSVIGGSKPLRLLSSVPEMETLGNIENESGNCENRPSWNPVRELKRSCSNESPAGTESRETNPFDELAADEELERLVVLQMAMQRHQLGILGLNDEPVSQCHEDDSLPKRPTSNIISEGFFWREYPSCEQVLYKHMERYYEVSAIQRNYKVQQSFNNILVQEVRAAAENSGFSFEASFDDKKLRDRIRCFYKTHLQNAKKRLATLQKHPDSLENRSLVAVYIRCVRDKNLSFQESLAMAPEFPKKRRRMDKVEKLKLDMAASDAGFASKLKQKRDKALQQQPMSKSDSVVVSHQLPQDDIYHC